MTNQNPASTSSQPSLDRDILAKLSAHADRSLDRLFTDIDELLSGDLESDVKSPPAHHTSVAQSNYNTDSFRSEDNPQHQQSATYTETSPRLTATLETPPPATVKPKPLSGIPIWLKALLGLGVTSIALSGLLLWLVNQRKIAIPQNIDTSWLPFQSQSQVSPADAKFAEYMRKSIAKIESTASIPAPTTTNLPNPADIALPTTSTPIATAPTQVIGTATTAAKPTAIGKKIALVKTSQNGVGKSAESSASTAKGHQATAVFQIDGKNQTIKIGQKIGSSNWSLINVSKKEVTVKRKGGEIRSIQVGQKF
jgi:hypothetical protein